VTAGEVPDFSAHTHLLSTTKTKKKKFFFFFFIGETKIFLGNPKNILELLSSQFQTASQLETKHPQLTKMSSDATMAFPIKFVFPITFDDDDVVNTTIHADGMYHPYPLKLPSGWKFDHLRGEDDVFLYVQVGEHVPNDSKGPNAGNKRPRPEPEAKHVTIRYTEPVLTRERWMMLKTQEEHAKILHQTETAFENAKRARLELEAAPATTKTDLVAAALEIHLLTKGRDERRAVRQLTYELKQSTKWFRVEAGVPCCLGGVPGKSHVYFKCGPDATGAKQNVLLPLKEETATIARTTPVRPEQLDFQPLGHGAFAAAFSADCTRVVSGDEDNMVRIWDANTGTVLLELAGHTKHVSSVAFSADGARIVSGSWDYTVRVWDAASGTEIKKLVTPRRDRVNSLALLPGGTHVLSAGSEGRVYRWNLDTGGIDVEFKTRFYSVYTMALSRCATKLVTGSHGRVSVFDTETGVIALDLQDHHGQCGAVAICNDGELVVSGGDDGVLRCSNRITGAVSWEIKTERAFNAATFSNDRAFVVTGNLSGHVLFRHAQTGRFLYELRVKGRVMSLAFSEADRYLLVASRDQFYDGQPRAFIHRWEMRDFLNELR